MTSIDTSKVNNITRDELAGLKGILASNKRALPTKINYNNICFDEFVTSMKYNPRQIFNAAHEFAEKKIVSAIDAFTTKDSVKRIGVHSWQITCGFITVDVCLHSNTEYTNIDFVHDDLAVHRSVVTVIASFDCNRVYRFNSCDLEIFRGVNSFYANLKSALMSN